MANVRSMWRWPSRGELTEQSSRHRLFGFQKSIEWICPRTEIWLECFWLVKSLYLFSFGDCNIELNHLLWFFFVGNRVSFSNDGCCFETLIPTCWVFPPCFGVFGFGRAGYSDTRVNSPMLIISMTAWQFQTKSIRNPSSRSVETSLVDSTTWILHWSTDALVGWKNQWNQKREYTSDIYIHAICSWKHSSISISLHQYSWISWIHQVKSCILW